MAEENQNKTSTASEWQQKMKMLFEQQKWDELISFLSEVIPTLKSDADKAFAYFWRGYAYNEKGKYDLAVADFNRTIELLPEFAAAYNSRGYAYNEKSKYDLAIADFNRTIELNPEHAAAYHNRGYAYNEKSKYDLAIADFNRTIELNPEHAAAYHNRGYAYNAKGENDLAIADFNHAIELKPEFTTAYHNRGYAYNAKGENDLAIADFNRAIELNPEYVSAYNNRGVAYNAKGKYDLAIADYNRAIELEPENVVAYINRGIVHSTQDNREHALINFNQAIALSPDNAVAYGSRGHIHNQNGEYDKAIADWKKAIELGTLNKEMVKALRADIAKSELHKQTFKRLPPKTGQASEQAVFTRLSEQTSMQSAQFREISMQFAHFREQMSSDAKRLREQISAELAAESARLRKELAAESARLRKEISEDLKSEFVRAEEFEKREKEHAEAKKIAGKRTDTLLRWLFVLYFGAFLALMLTLILRFVFNHTGVGVLDILPWLPVIFLTSSPLIWAARISNREETRQLALCENAYANGLMARLLFYKSQGKHEEKMVKKFFDHHDLRGSPQLILGAEPGQKMITDNAPGHVINQIRQGEKQKE